MIKLSHVSFAYDQVSVLKNITAELPPSRLTFLLGENGSGKTTLLKCLLQLLDYTGQILIDSHDASQLRPLELAKLIAYIPQNHTPKFNFRVIDVVLMGVTHSLRLIQQPSIEHLALAEEALEAMNITHLRERGYGEISGGERQLVLIARALAQQTKILVMDEPTNNLDLGNQYKLLELTKRLTKQGLSLIITSHQPAHALQYGDEVLLLHRGKLIAQGKPDEILTESNLSAIYGISLAVREVDGVKIPLFLGGDDVLDRR